MDLARQSTPRRMGWSSLLVQMRKRSIARGKIITATWLSSNITMDCSHCMRIFRRSMSKQVRKFWRRIRSVKLAEPVQQLEAIFILKFAGAMFKIILQHKTPSCGWLQTKMEEVNYSER